MSYLHNCLPWQDRTNTFRVKVIYPSICGDGHLASVVGLGETAQGCIQIWACCRLSFVAGPGRQAGGPAHWMLRLLVISYNKGGMGGEWRCIVMQTLTWLPVPCGHRGTIKPPFPPGSAGPGPLHSTLTTYIHSRLLHTHASTTPLYCHLPYSISSLGNCHSLLQL